MPLPFKGLNFTDILRILVGWNDIAYNYLVCEDGRVYEGRGWNVQGSQALGYNEVSIGICIIGDYNRRLPVPAALNATQELLACGVEEVRINYNFKTISERGC